MVPEILRKFKGETVAYQWVTFCLKLSFNQQISDWQGTYQRRRRGEVSGRFRKLKV